MTKKHIHCDVIKAWADGAEIEWRDDDKESWAPCLHPSFFNYYQYRVKPKPITKWYRVALFKWNDGFNFITLENSTQEASFEKQPNFVRWVTERQYVEVE